MAPLTSDASAPGPLRPIGALSTLYSAQAYRGVVRSPGREAPAPFAVAGGRRLRSGPPSPGAAPVSRQPTRSASPSASTSPYLAMVINDLQSTLRMAEAFRQAAALAEPAVAYRQLVSRVYTLELQAQHEIKRLQGEGISISRQWFA